MLLVFEEYREMLKPLSKVPVRTSRDAQLIQTDSLYKLNFLIMIYSSFICKTESKATLPLWKYLRRRSLFMMTCDMLLETLEHWESVWFLVFSFLESHRAPSVQRHFSLSRVVCDIIK